MTIAKEQYTELCNKTYVPIYSKPWWMDAVCGEENWDVWLYKPHGEVLAAMPYYMETRGKLLYITKPPLTQNNGIVFCHPKGSGVQSRASFERKVIEKASEFIRELGVDVYEQQYHYSFQNWQPFYWKDYSCLLRYTYVIEDTSNLEDVFEQITSKQRSVIRKGSRQANISQTMGAEHFFEEHEKIFAKQGLVCPFSKELWMRLSCAAIEHEGGKILCATDVQNHVCSIAFCVWDEESMYHLLGGAIPEYASLDTYSALIFHCIQLACEMGLKYDFEGSMIERIAKSFEQFGGIPKPYYRIRKIFNPDIIRKEAEEAIKRLDQEMETK